MDKRKLLDIIDGALEEDIGTGDHTSLATISEDAQGEAQVVVKADGILAGVELAQMIFQRVDPNLVIQPLMLDGDRASKNDVAMLILGPVLSILKAERIVLNFMQRMSGIASKTRQMKNVIQDYPHVQLLDTRKTTPGLRILEKWAVRIGGGANHRMSLDDMIMIKDNHVDYAGGITNAIRGVVAYKKAKGLENLKVEVETRNLSEVKEVLLEGNVDRIMLDNFAPELAKQALELIGDRVETEISGGIDEKTIADYAKLGPDFISSGSLTHSYQSLDISLKAKFKSANPI